MTQLARSFLGQRSPIFTHRGQQLLKEVKITEKTDFDQWILIEHPESEYEAQVCGPVSHEDISRITKELKSDRAPGVDGILTDMVKSASSKFMSKFTELINEILHEGYVPDSLQTGKMTLIDKKEPSLDKQKKRPLTVSSVFLSVVTKLIHERMSTICEEQGFYGSVQYGFRKKRSTTDCVFIILAAIRKAKRKHRSISIAFCDIAKVYDSVC